MKSCSECGKTMDTWLYTERDGGFREVCRPCGAKLGVPLPGTEPKPKTVPETTPAGGTPQFGSTEPEPKTVPETTPAGGTPQFGGYNR